MIVLAMAFAQPATARRMPAQLTPTFSDRGPAQPVDPKTALCPVRFEMVDDRKFPDVAGVIGQRAVLAPKDVSGWLRAVAGGFVARGVKPILDADPSSSAPIVRFVLQTAWIASSVETYSANVVIRVEAQGSRNAPIDRIYRGRVSRTAYWSGGVDTLQSAMDGAFGDALDQIAPELIRLCVN